MYFCSDQLIFPFVSVHMMVEVVVRMGCLFIRLIKSDKNCIWYRYLHLFFFSSIKYNKRLFYKLFWIITNSLWIYVKKNFFLFFSPNNVNKHHWTHKFIVITAKPKTKPTKNTHTHKKKHRLHLPHLFKFDKVNK